MQKTLKNPEKLLELTNEFRKVAGNKKKAQSLVVFL